ncbi:MAG: ParB/RepB/Spo0J family partition protein [Clostridia bacterium]|nr:ParB/RepB/Spo0J family partition protein [Clostridia bacterium]
MSEWKRSFFSRPREGRVMQVPVDQVCANPAQPRRQFAEDKLKSLAQSIRENGLLQPLTVRADGGRIVLIAGERRLRAARLAGLATVPCLVCRMDDRQSAAAALIENLQREELNCFEQAEGLRRLIEEFSLTQEETARRLGCAQPTVANKLRLLTLTLDERSALLQAGATERHARALLRLPDTQRAPLIERLSREHWTVARTEREVEARLHPAAAPKQRVVPLVRDVRLFFNTVEKAVDTMRRSGVLADASRRETDAYFEYVVRIPKPEASLSKTGS